MPRPVSNPPNPWESTHVEWLEDPPQARLEVFEEQAKSMLSENHSPDVPFRWGVNPYRGCQHACAYCYARPSHQWLSFGAGTDFDRKIVVKKNAHECLRRQLTRRGWKREVLAFSGITDCYQPLEACYRLTQRCLRVCLDTRTPVAVITKAALVQRDRELLAEIHRRAGAVVHVSIPFLDAELARKIEPGVSSPARRFETLARLSEAGVPTGIAIAPLIPGLNESDIPGLLSRARAAGATHAFLTLLRLPREVLPVFVERLQEAVPERAQRVLSGLRDMRGGSLRDSRFGHRMEGQGARFETARRQFEIHCRRLGLAWKEVSVLRPALPRARGLFDSP